MNIQDAIDVIESVSGFTDESTPVGEAWAEVLSFIHRPAALAQPEPVAPTDEKLILSTYCNARRSYCHDGPEHHNWQRDAERGATMAGLRAVLQRYAHPTIQPVAASELVDLAHELRKTAEYLQGGCGWVKALDAIERAASLIESGAIQRFAPIPVSERWPEFSDCDPFERVWALNPVLDHWKLTKINRSIHTHWLPHWALPIPC